MKNFLTLDNFELKSSFSIKSFIKASSEIKGCPITNILKEDKNIWISEEFLPQEIILNFKNIKLKEYPKKLTAIGIYCWNKYPTNPKIVEVLISRENRKNFLSLGHFDLSFKDGKQLIYLDDENDIELEEVLNTVNFNNLILKLIIKETFGGKHTYINSLYLYDNIDTNNINSISYLDNEPNSNNISNEMNNVINEEYMNIDENKSLNNNNNLNENITDNINNLDNKKMNFNRTKSNIEIKENENQEKTMFNKHKQFNNINNNYPQNLEDDNISEYKRKTMSLKYNNKSKYSTNILRETKIPQLFKNYSNADEREKTNSFRDSNINTTIKQYNNKNILDYSNNSNILSNLNIHLSNELKKLIYEFKIYREKQESIMNEYEKRFNYLEKKIVELKNTIKKMNITMNNIIESQFIKNKELNDYFLKECQNMVNEAIVNVLTNIGRNTDSYIPSIYENLMRKNKNINLNNNKILSGKNSNNYIIGQNYSNKKLINNNMNNINKVDNNNYYNQNNIENSLYNNKADNYVNNMKNNGEEYKEVNNDDKKYNSNFNNNFKKENNDNNNNMEYNENNKINKKENTIIDNNNLKMNLNINNLAKNNNNDNQIVKNNISSEIYNDGLTPYEERIKSNPKKFSNIFTRNSSIKTKILNSNNLYNEKFLKNKIKSKSNTKMEMKNTIKNKIENNSIENISNEKERKYLSNNNSRKILSKFNRKIIDENSKNSNFKINKELSSDISIDDILINNKITENILKPTLEKFENLMSINNFGKSQNVYSSNSFNTKKEIFEKIQNQSKLLKRRNKVNDDNNNSKKNEEVDDGEDRDNNTKK